VDVADETKPFLLYDGECSFCRTGSEWITARSQAPAVPWQQLGSEELGRLGLTLAEAEGAAWWIDPTARAERGHLAIARALRGAPGLPSLLGRVLLVPPFCWLAAGAYPLLSRWRHRLPALAGPGPATRRR
jgi:predicted DCC family thiol-disulfide oxidoreductase YuxK